MAMDDYTGDYEFDSLNEDKAAPPVPPPLPRGKPADRFAFLDNPPPPLAKPTPVEKPADRFAFLDNPPPPLAKPPSFLEETRDRFSRGLGVAKKNLSEFADTAGSMATSALDAASLGLYSKGRNAIADVIAPETSAQVKATEAKFNEEHPFATGASRAVGYLAPWGAPARAAEATSAGLGMLTREAPAVAQKVLTSRPVAGAITGGVSNAATSAAEDVTAGAPAEEVLRNAGKAGLVGAGIGGIVGSVPAVAESRAAQMARERMIKFGKEKATADLGHDISAAEGPRARETAQKRVAEAKNELFELAQETPGLRQAFGSSAEKALPKIRELKNDIAKPLDGMFDEVDRLTADRSTGVPEHITPELSGAGTTRIENPNFPTRPESPDIGSTVPVSRAGGVRLGDIADGFENAAKEAGKRASGQAEATRFRAVRENFLKAYREPNFDPTAQVETEWFGKAPAEEAIAKLEKAKAGAPPDFVADADRQIASVREQASTGINLDKRIPTATFRQEVTDLHKTAEAAMGGLEGTARHEALDKLYRTGKQIIDEHLDNSGLPAEELTRLRDINRKYFILTRAEAAIESRGWKEANRPGFHIPRGVHAAAEGASLLGMTAYGATHPHAIAPMLATYGALKAAPAIAARANWAMANMSPTAGPPGITANPAAIARLIQAGKAGATRAQLQAQAEQDGVPPEIAANIAQSQGR